MSELCASHRGRARQRASSTRRRPLYGVALAVMSVAASGLLADGSARAIDGGDPVNVVPTWAARIDYQGADGTVSTCTGALVAEQWVLTAARCTADSSTQAIPVLDVPRDPTGFRLVIGPGASTARSAANPEEPTTTTTALATAAPAVQVRTVDRIERAAVMWNATTGQWNNDLALLHLAETTPWPAGFAPLPLVPDESSWTPGAELFGWGLSDGTLTTTKASDWTIAATCVTPTTTCLTPAATASTTSGTTDLGGPWTRFVGGGWVLGAVNAGAASSPDDSATPNTASAGTATAPAAPAATYATSVLPQLPWIRQITGLPAVAPGTIVTLQGTYDSWLVGPNGFRQKIPTGEVFSCLQGNGANVGQLTGFDLASVPLDAAAVATCTPDPSRTTTTVSKPVTPTATVLTMPDDTCATIAPLGGGTRIVLARAPIGDAFATGEGGASAVLVSIKRGDLAGRGNNDFLLQVVCSGGGTGSTGELHVFGQSGRYLGRAKYGSQVTTRPSFYGEGDREGIQSLRVRSGRIVVTYMAHAEGDGLCCPSLVVTDVLGGAPTNFRLISRTVASAIPPESTEPYRCPVGGVDELVKNVSAPPCDSVKEMQYRLQSLGYDIAADGLFGSATERAVRDFQQTHGLTVDGRCGPRTWQALIDATSGD